MVMVLESSDYDFNPCDLSGPNYFFDLKTLTKLIATFVCA